MAIVIGIFCVLLFLAIVAGVVLSGGRRRYPQRDAYGPSQEFFWGMLGLGCFSLCIFLAIVTSPSFGQAHHLGVRESGEAGALWASIIFGLLAVPCLIVCGLYGTRQRAFDRPTWHTVMVSVFATAILAVTVGLGITTYCKANVAHKAAEPDQLIRELDREYLIRQIRQEKPAKGIDAEIGSAIAARQGYLAYRDDLHDPIRHAVRLAIIFLVACIVWLLLQKSNRRRSVEDAQMAERF